MPEVDTVESLVRKAEADLAKMNAAMENDDRLILANPFDDDSRFALLTQRFETPDFIRDELRGMMRDLVNSLPVDDPARLLWAVLPEAPGWSIYEGDHLDGHAGDGHNACAGT